MFGEDNNQTHTHVEARVGRSCLAECQRCYVKSEEITEVTKVVGGWSSDDRVYLTESELNSLRYSRRRTEVNKVIRKYTTIVWTTRVMEELEKLTVEPHTVEVVEAYIPASR